MCILPCVLLFLFHQKIITILCSLAAVMARFDPETRHAVYKLPRHSHCPVLVGFSSHDDQIALQQNGDIFEKIIYRRSNLDNVLEQW